MEGNHQEGFLFSISCFAINRLKGFKQSMSQNKHTLLLFFKDQTRHKLCLLMLLRLKQAKWPEAQKIASRLKLSLIDEWQQQWYQHEVTGSPQHIRLDFATSPRNRTQLQVIQKLFQAGVTGVVCETHFGAAKETERQYFLSQHLVNEKLFYKHLPQCIPLVRQQLSASFESMPLAKPVKLATLIELAKRQAQEERSDGIVRAKQQVPKPKPVKQRPRQSTAATQQPVEKPIPVTATQKPLPEVRTESIQNQESTAVPIAEPVVPTVESYESDEPLGEITAQRDGELEGENQSSNPMLKAIGTGLLQAAGFGVVTILLFKGLWLWVSLTALLAVSLPIYHTQQLNKDMDLSEQTEGAV